MQTWARRFKRWLIEIVLKPRWIVNEDGELGLKIRGAELYYYKWSDPMIVFGDYAYREAYKREFGETIISKIGEFN